MKIIGKTAKRLFYTALCINIILLLLCVITGRCVSDKYKVNRGETLKIESIMPVTASFEGSKSSQATVYSVGDSYKVDLKLFGVIPFKTAEVEVVDESYVTVLGQPFGMKIYTDGVLVINVTTVDTSDGVVNPAGTAGVRVGDYVKSVNGEKITCNEDLSKLVAECGGSKINLEIIREGEKINLSVCPAMSSESGTYKIGLWVRDSSAGIGTLTLYSPSNDIVCGLGHGICDSDTECLLSVESGQLVEASIASVEKGTAGNPGELKGKFSYNPIADILLNSTDGVYGRPVQNIDTSSMIEVALKQEIEDGDAQILCTVDGDTPKLYSCTVKKRTAGYLAGNQNMTVRITDKELIEKTGGIVQGMSGSPILQNRKLIGAITHVLVDDPTAGYGIFAENTLETARSAANESKLKEAS